MSVPLCTMRVWPCSLVKKMPKQRFPLKGIGFLDERLVSANFRPLHFHPVKRWFAKGVSEVAETPWTCIHHGGRHILYLQSTLTFPSWIGIVGAAVTRRPLPHHRAHGSVHGDSIGCANSPRSAVEYVRRAAPTGWGKRDYSRRSVSAGRENRGRSPGGLGNLQITASFCP